MWQSPLFGAGAGGVKVLSSCSKPILKSPNEFFTRFLGFGKGCITVANALNMISWVRHPGTNGTGFPQYILSSVKTQSCSFKANELLAVDIFGLISLLNIIGYQCSHHGYSVMESLLMSKFIVLNHDGEQRRTRLERIREMMNK